MAEPCSDATVLGSIIQRRRSIRLRAKGSKKSNSNSSSDKASKQNTKKIFAMSKQCECSNCSSPNVGEKTINTLSIISTNEKEYDKCYSNSGTCIPKKCTKKLGIEKSLVLSDKKLLKTDSVVQRTSSWQTPGTDICDNEVVMTRLMRKRKKLLENGQFKLSSLQEKTVRMSRKERTNTESEELCSSRKYIKTEISIDQDEKKDDSETLDKEGCANHKLQLHTDKESSQAEVKTITFEEWQKEASNKWAAYSSNDCDCSAWQNWSNSSDSQKTGTGCSQERHASSSHSADRKSNSSSRRKNEHSERISNNKLDENIDLTVVPLEEEWSEPKNVRYREISGWPHLNDCIQTLEVLNIGGTNVLGEFIPFILLYAPRLKSLGQWINTMIYGKLYHYLTF